MEYNSKLNKGVAWQNRIAWRYLWLRRREKFFSLVTGFSLLGITLGVATLIIVMSVMNGFRHDLMGKVLDFNSHLSVYDTENEFLNYDQLVPQLKSISEIKEVVPILEEQAMITYKGKSFGVMVRAMPYKDLMNRTILVSGLQEGNFDQFQYNDPLIAIGARLAEKMGVYAGFTISLIIPDGNMTPFGTMPRIQNFKISSIFEVGMYEYDLGVVMIPFSAAQDFFQKPNSLSQIEIYLHNPYKTDLVIQEILNKYPNPLKFVSWSQAHAGFFEVIKIERNVMFLILSLIIIIAAFNIISGLAILIKDKSQDIAILKTMGASTQDISNIFFGAGTIIGVIGSTGGVILGFLGSYYLENIRQFIQNIFSLKLFDAEFYFLSKMPVLININDIIIIFTMTMVICMLAAIYPARRAAKLNPIDALRNE